MAMEAGSVVGGDFRVIEHLASGGMGSVYTVEQLSTGKRRAMKVMSANLATNERARERFVLEARVGSQIASDHVVEVVSAGIDDATGAPFLVMEFLEGEELSDVVARRGALPALEVAEVFRQAGHALGQAHAQGIVHRDLKPENIFVATSRREGVPFTVKILDFGIAKLVAERTNDGTQPMGTPLYMSPEQTDRDGGIGPQSDVWPLGLIAFYLLTGVPYWAAAQDTMSQLLREVVLEPLAPASERAAALGVAERLPPGFDAWFARCVVRDTAHRFPDGGACTRAFAELVEGKLTDASLSAAQTVGVTPAGFRPIASGGGNMGSVGGTEVEAARPAPASAKMIPIALGLLAVGGVSGYFIMGSQKERQVEPVASTQAPEAVSAPAAAPSVAPTCPAGSLPIEGGNMFMGSAEKDLEDDVRPSHRVSVSAFCLDETEVTVEAYEACLNAGNCPKPLKEVSFPGLGPSEAEAFASLCNLGVKGREKHPFNCVTHKEASDYCRDAGGRLPTEAEWEFAARGPSQRKYPWGEAEPDASRLNAAGSEHVAWQGEHSITSYGQMYEGDDGFVGTAPVKTFAGGKSEGGIYDLAGNVWEWTADWYGLYDADEATDPQGPPEGEKRVVRGGGFNGLKPSWARPAYRWKTEPENRSHGIGFRCAYDR